MMRLAGIFPVSWKGDCFIEFCNKFLFLINSVMVLFRALSKKTRAPSTVFTSSYR